ncbi:MAG: Tol-Pal system beta propeller repeat protein TolB [Pseudomonadota bacterium]|nr:Tol-Pal system beta propeller repeat protein TolB [Pseudomonadota bacterium]
MKNCRASAVLAIVLALVSTAAFGALRIEITQGVSGALPIAVVPFQGGASAPGVPVDQIIAADLARSGRFSLLPERELPQFPRDADGVNFALWRTAGVDHLVVGEVIPTGNAQFAVEFRLFDVLRGQSIAAYRIPVSEAEIRTAAHQVSDIIYEKLIGEPGAFNTRIAYVSALKRPKKGEQGEYRLMVADADGANSRTIVRSTEPLMSPSWSADGTHLAYVSFEGRRSRIFVQEMATGKRRELSSRPGINGAPAWSPDGKTLAVALSNGAHTDLYLIDSESGQVLRQLTRGGSIDTEPDFSPDGKRIAFTSDRGGRPQIYELELSDGSMRRLTFEGNYNARPRYSSDGKYLAVVHGSGGRYSIAVLDRANRSLRVLSDGPLDESPSFSPNGAMIIYASDYQRAGVLSTVSFDGRVRQRLAGDGDVREAAWSPFRQKPTNRADE